MAAVVAAAEVVFELGAEHVGDGDVLDEDGVLAVGMVVCEGLGRDVLGDPVGVAGAAVEGGGEGGGGAEVVYGAGEAVLEDAAGVDLCEISTAWVCGSGGRTRAPWTGVWGCWATGRGGGTGARCMPGPVVVVVVVTTVAGASFLVDQSAAVAAAPVAAPAAATIARVTLDMEDRV